MIFLPRGENSKSCRWFLISLFNTARLSYPIFLISLFPYKNMIIPASWLLNKMRTDLFQRLLLVFLSHQVLHLQISYDMLLHCCSCMVCLSTLAMCHFSFSWGLHASLSPAFLHPLLILMCLCFTVCPWGNKLPRASAQQAKRESSAAVGRASCQQKLYAQSVSVVFSISYSKQSDKGNAPCVCAFKQFVWWWWGKRLKCGTLWLSYLSALSYLSGLSHWL